MDKDDVGAGEIFSVPVSLNYEVAEVRQELKVERAYRRAGVAAACRLACHVKQAVGEVNVAGLNQLDETLTFRECRGIGVAEYRIAF